ncbi:MAG: hypothetical protein COT14_02550 [Candidatus Diapherotrites archaeon CG08_land_8_20_14_0_20_30_16]|nr:MAG: hypothetical protein COT14_02550 [Candidatus Diapherotrites archaeon CG08_land_8_20_14_0_20_30_16]
MVAKKILSVKPITNAEADKYLKDIEEEFTKKEKEVPYEIQQTKDYLGKIPKGQKKDEKELAQKLKALNLNENVIIELINIMPKNEEIIKTILYKRTEFNDDTVKQIKEILQ